MIYSKCKKNKGGRKDEPQTIRVAQILHSATANQHTWRACRVESTTQRDHKRRNAGSNGESLQRQRIQELKDRRRGNPPPLKGGKSKNQKQKNKRNAKRRKGVKKWDLIKNF